MKNGTMNHPAGPLLDEPIPTANRPKQRWFQFSLKTLFVLPVIVGLLLVLHIYWVDWRKYRPPYRDTDLTAYTSAHDRFYQKLKDGSLESAYNSTSSRFKERTSRSEFEAIVHRFLAKLNGPSSQEVGAMTSGIMDWRLPGVRRSHRWTAIKGRNNSITVLWIWVGTDEQDDSFFYRRPPPPRVEEIQIDEVFEERRR